MKKTFVKKYKEQQHQQVTENSNETQVKNSDAGSRNATRKILRASRNPLTSKTKICNNSQQPPFSPVIRDSTNEANQSSDPNKASSTQNTPGQSSEVKCSNSKLSICSENTGGPVPPLNSAEHQNSTIEEMDVDGCRAESESSAVDDDEWSTSSEMSSEEELTAGPSFNEQESHSFELTLEDVDVIAKEFCDLCQKMKEEFSQMCKVAFYLKKSLAQSCEVIENIAKEFDRRGEKGDSNDGDDDDDDDDNDCDFNKGDNETSDDDKDEGKQKKIQKTTRGNIRTFVLPPEYDPDDTRWTLKYRENDPELNLVELVPNSNVFINPIKLAYYKQVAKDPKALARMLLVEIFSQSALSVCSLTGARANAFDITGSHVRPGLDEPARMAILSFVEEHTSCRNWGAFNSRAILSSLRSKIQEVRAKHGKTA